MSTKSFYFLWEAPFLRLFGVLAQFGNEWKAILDVNTLMTFGQRADETFVTQIKLQELAHVHSTANV
jgi:hypothetical protein